MATTKAKKQPKKKPKKKTAILNVGGVDLPVTFNPNGRLDKKSQDAFDNLMLRKSAERSVGKFRGKDVVLVGSFVGLTVAYKLGLVDLLSPFFSQEFVAGFIEDLTKDFAPSDVAGFVVGGIGGGMMIRAIHLKIELEHVLKEIRWYEAQIKKAEEDIARVEKLLSEGRIKPAPVLIPGGRISGPDVSPPGVIEAVSEAERARGEAFIASRQEFISFATANIVEVKKGIGLRDSTRRSIEAQKWAVSAGLAGASIYLLQSHTISDIVEITPGIQ